MQFWKREIATELMRAAKGFPAIVLTGPRRSGKTTLVRKLFPRAEHVLLEDPEVLDRVQADPRGFLDGLKLPVILDEIQNAPALFAHVRARIDREPRRTGRWVFTGSQEAPLMKGVTESLAGRAALFQLLPLSTREHATVSLFHGGFPEVLARRGLAPTWFRSYVQTYLERDVRAVAEIRDLITFRRFLALTASRVGQVLNKTDLAAPLGVSVPTITHWLSILEITGQILIVPPWFENLGKRIVKSPKLYFIDSGLACHLLGIDSASVLERSPFLGALYEGFVASELVKRRVNSGRRQELYWFRDHQGLEVDFVLPLGDRHVALIEAKATKTVRSADALPLERLARAMPGTEVQQIVVHRGGSTPAGRAIRPGASALTLPELLDTI